MRLLIFFYVQIKKPEKVLLICQKLKTLDIAEGYLYEALLYEHGKGVEKDEKFAINTLKELKDSGYTRASIYLSGIYGDKNNEHFNLNTSIKHLKEYIETFKEFLFK